MAVTLPIRGISILGKHKAFAFQKREKIEWLGKAIKRGEQTFEKHIAYSVNY